MTADDRRTGGREKFDARTERARPSHATALAHGMALTIAHGDMAAREITTEWHEWHAAMIAIRPEGSENLQVIA